jgi:DNA polymerase-3 subunit beta
MISHCSVDDSKDGKVLIQTKNIQKLLTTLNADDIVSVSISESSEELIIDVVGKIYKFITMSGTFPQTPYPTGTSFDVNFQMLNEKLQLVKKSASKDNGSVELKVIDNILQLNTTDSYRLSLTKLFDTNIEKLEGLFSINVIEKISKFDIRKITIDKDGRSVLFSAPNVEIITRLLNGKFPDISGYLNKLPSESVCIDRNLFLASMERLESLVNSENTNLNILINENVLSLSLTNNDVGKGLETMELTDNEDSFKFIINFYFIKDAVESLQSDIIHLMYDTDTRPIYITDKGTNSAIHIISLISDAKSYKTS